MRPLPPARLRAQAALAAEVCARVLWQSLGLGRPADRALAALLRSDPRVGGRDRRLIAETVFAVLRWWGWVRPLAPAAFSAALAAGEASTPPPMAAETWAPLLGAAWVLEGGDFPEAARLWVSLALPDAGSAAAARPGASLAVRAGLLKPFFPPGECLPGPEALLPGWSWAEIASPRPKDDLLDWLQRRPPVWLRACTEDLPGLLGELHRAGLDARPHPALPTALRTSPPRLNLQTLAAFRDGRIEVQDLASQLIGHICAPLPGQRWWDACAGAGGKTLHLAALMGGKGSVTASDIRPYILEALRRRARRAGFPNIRTREWKGKPLPEHRGGYDGVLVDAPCSGSGTWRRNPHGRWTTRRADLEEFARLQARLLENAAGTVRPGGTLVYATCSLFRLENEDVVHGFLAGHPEFSLEPFAHPLTGAPVPGTLMIWPWDGDCDAMFAARLRRSPAPGSPEVGGPGADG